MKYNLFSKYNFINKRVSCNNMENNYLDHIVSDNNNIRFLYRCGTEELDKKLSGDFFGRDLDSSTKQPKDLQTALALYKTGMHHGNYALVISIPRQNWETKYKDFIKPENHCSNVLKEHIIGYIDREKDLYTPNPHL